ncbi:hypothetical protein RZS08_11195, partial [Arthrospira platensis SPKY1]|nr:hypothetical protein [Arthrospira platensis SPKY1]
FGRGGAGVGGGDSDAGFPGGARHRFVAGEQMTAFGRGVDQGMHERTSLVRKEERRRILPCFARETGKF